MALANNQNDINDPFKIVVIIINIASTLLKHCDIFRNKHTYKVIETFSNRTLSSGKGLNQEINLKSVNDTY